LNIRGKDDMALTESKQDYDEVQQLVWYQWKYVIQQCASILRNTIDYM